MLPFPKRSSRAEEVELDEGDLVEVVDVSPESADDTQEIYDAPTTARISLAELESARESARALFARKPLDSGLEDDVAGDILASIGRESQRVSVRSITPSTVPTPPSRPSRPSLRTASNVANVPGVIPPPPRVPLFARTTTPPPMMARPPSLPHVPPESIAPTSVPSLPSEPSVILVRERRPTGWIVASGIVGAALAVLATRVLSPPAPPAVAAPPPVVTILTAALPAVSIAPPAAPAPVPAPAAAPSAASMQFADGVSIPAASASAKKPTKPRRPKPAAPAMVPDSSNAIAGTASAVAAPAPAPTSASPERDLASAQLKAMK